MITLVITPNPIWTLGNEDGDSKILTFNEFSTVEEAIEKVKDNLKEFDSFTSNQYALIYIFQVLVKEGFIDNKNVQIHYYTRENFFINIVFDKNGNLSEYPSNLNSELLMRLI